MTTPVATAEQPQTFIPDSMPVTYSRDEIISAMQSYQVREGGEACESPNCNAMAMFFAARASLKPELVFCGHHGKKFSAKLKEQGFLWYDRSTELPSGERRAVNI